MGIFRRAPNSSSPAIRYRASSSLAQLCQQLELDLLNLRESLPLVRQRVVDLFVKVTNLELGAQVRLGL